MNGTGHRTAAMMAPLLLTSGLMRYEAVLLELRGLYYYTAENMLRILRGKNKKRISFFVS